MAAFFNPYDDGSTMPQYGLPGAPNNTPAPPSSGGWQLPSGLTNSLAAGANFANSKNGIQKAQSGLALGDTVNKALGGNGITSMPGIGNFLGKFAGVAPGGGGAAAPAAGASGAAGAAAPAASAGSSMSAALPAAEVASAAPMAAGAAAPAASAAAGGGAGLLGALGAL